MIEQRINVIIEPALKKRIQIKALKEGKTLTDVVLYLLKKWLEAK